MSGGDAILGVCFDLDGTLVDSERLQWEAYRRVLADHGVDIGLDEYRRHFIAVAGGAEYACRRYGLPFDAATLRARKAAVYHQLIAAGVPLMQGARACLERLRGGWRLAVVTNSTRAEATTILDRLGLTALLHAVVAREDYAAAKPAPDAYLGAAAAHAAGMWVVAVPGELTADQSFDGAWRRLPNLDALAAALLGATGAPA